MMETIQENGCLLDQGYTIEYQNQTLINSSAFICKNKSGKYDGIVYGDYDYKIISNWDGSITIPAKYYGEYTGNMGDKRIFIRFRYENRNFFGRWFGMKWSQTVRVRECK